MGKEASSLKIYSEGIINATVDTDSDTIRMSINHAEAAKTALQLYSRHLFAVVINSPQEAIATIQNYNVVLRRRIPANDRAVITALRDMLVKIAKDQGYDRDHTKHLDRTN